MKAAFAAFEEANMPRLKQENPNMRLSQLKQLLKKEWTKSPENPLNQRFTAYNKWTAYPSANLSGNDDNNHDLSRTL